LGFFNRYAAPTLFAYIGAILQFEPTVSYQFVLSLPERLVRSLGALTGGFLREAGAILLPARIRRTALYRVMVEVTLRFLIAELGRVPGVYAKNQELEDFLLKRTASHGIELLGLLTLHVSPIWVLAALADATGAGHALIEQIAQSLKNEGLLERNASFETLDQVLNGLEKTSSHLADTLNMPPVTLAGLRREWERFKEALPSVPQANMPSLVTLESLWNKLLAASAAEHQSVFVLCSTLAVGALAELPSNVFWLSRAAQTAAKRTGQLLGETLLDHYVVALNQISQQGFIEYWRKQFRPYLRAAALQFVPANESTTEKFLRSKRRP
jgi:hypothetical protein